MEKGNLSTMYFSTRASTYLSMAFQTFPTPFLLILLMVHDFDFSTDSSILSDFSMYFSTDFSTFLDFSYTYSDFSNTLSNFSNIFLDFYNTFSDFYNTFFTFRLFTVLFYFSYFFILHFFTNKLNPTSCFTHWTAYQCMFDWTLR